MGVSDGVRSLGASIIARVEKGGASVFTRLDHAGIVVPSWEEARRLLLDQFGLALDTERTALPDGNYYAPGNTRIFFVRVGAGDTRIEVLIPQDTLSGIARFMARRGPGLH